MNTKFILKLLFISILIGSCKKELEPQESSGVIPPVAENAAAAPTPTTTTMQPQAPQTIQTQAVTVPGMNPPHGQPNHRCDIPVGAPLNSPAGKTATPDKPKMMIDTSKSAAVNTAPALLKGHATPAEATPVVTAPGMNPPHGQDGHRCDIAVGAALPKS